MKKRVGLKTISLGKQSLETSVMVNSVLQKTKDSGFMERAGGRRAVLLFKEIVLSTVGQFSNLLAPFISKQNFLLYGLF